jgi:3-methyladenine DNA glycosylase AlkD
VGWMLREVGKRVDPTLLISYLDDHAAALSRTSLSYATEHLTPEQRTYYRSLR